MALPVIEEIQDRGKQPIVVGGSGLYLKFLSHGPSPLPSGNPELRLTLEARSQDELVSELKRLDPLEASRTDLANRRFVTRALEICLLSNQPCSTLRDRWQSRQSEINSELAGLFIQRERADLHDRIERRTTKMIDHGALDEVRSLHVNEHALSKAIGVPQIRRFLSGKIDLPTCHAEISIATRQYAKRQETWFRREAWLQRIDWPPQSAVPLDAALEAIANRL
jgi:tRNA dimethylallyltransferase